MSIILNLTVLVQELDTAFFFCSTRYSVFEDKSALPVELCSPVKMERHFFFLFCRYVIFSLIYYLAGGVDADGNVYIYPILDWTKPGMTIGTICGGAVCVVAIHLLVFAFYKFRVFLSEECCSCGREPRFNEMDSLFWTNSGKGPTTTTTTNATTATPETNPVYTIYGKEGEEEDQADGGGEEGPRNEDSSRKSSSVSSGTVGNS